MSKMTVLNIPPAYNEPGSFYDSLPLIPETHLLFTGPQVCARHGMLSGINYYRAGRISYLMIASKEYADGTYLEKIRECAAEILRGQSLKALFILVTCSDVVLATDTELMREQLENELGISVRFIIINRLNMYDRGDKNVTVPGQTEILCSLLKKERNEKPFINLIGTLTEVKRSDLIFSMAEKSGLKIRTMNECSSFEEFISMSDAVLNLALDEEAAKACAELEKRCKMPWLPFRSCMHMESMVSQYEAVAGYLNVRYSADEQMRVAGRLYSEITGMLKETEIIVNGAGMDSPWSFGREIAERGIDIRTFYYTRFSGKEPEHRKALENMLPEMEIIKADSNMSLLPPVELRNKQQQALTGFEKMIDDLRFLKEILQ